MDALAVSYAGELARWNIETCIIVPGVFTSGTNHFAHAGHPGDQARASEYATGPTAGLDQEIMTGEQRISPVGGASLKWRGRLSMSWGCPLAQGPSGSISIQPMTEHRL